MKYVIETVRTYPPEIFGRFIVDRTYYTGRSYKNKDGDLIAYQTEALEKAKQYINRPKAERALKRLRNTNFSYGTYPLIRILSVEEILMYEV